MKYSWSNTVFPIAAIFSFRMLGLFLLIPVFTLNAAMLHGATPTLIGFALGGYGLTQGLLQIPFGMLSDRFGRKPIITLGLFLFACGSLLGAMTDSIYGMILARTLQGTGAIGSVLIALLADLTPDTQRTKAMAVIGVTIGLSFSLAMVISPIISHQFGLAGIFYLTAILAVFGLLLLHLVIPTPVKECFHADTEAKPALFRSVLSNRHLQRLNIGIFCQHFILTATFYSIPLLLNEQVKLGHLTQQWHFYLPLMLISFVIMIPFILFAEKKKQIKTVFLLSVLLTGTAQALLAFTGQNWTGLCLFMLVYFLAFNILEATLPSLVSKLANPNSKGTAMGIYSTSQFLGLFAGGSLAGLLYQWGGSHSIFIVNAMLCVVWFTISLFMDPEAYLTTLILSYQNHSPNTSTVISALLKLPGVKEAIFSPEEQIIYLRIAKRQYESGSAERTLTQFR